MQISVEDFIEDELYMERGNSDHPADQLRDAAAQARGGLVQRFDAQPYAHRIYSFDEPINEVIETLNEKADELAEEAWID